MEDSLATTSNLGFVALQGPHHVAEKVTYYPYMGENLRQLLTTTIFENQKEHVAIRK